MMTRQDAIWHAKHVFNIVIERCFNAQNLKDAREFDEAKQIVIEALQQEPKRGKWVEDGCYPYYVCNKCGQMCGTQSNGVEVEPLFTNFCPNCGARMEVEK